MSLFNFWAVPFLFINFKIKAEMIKGKIIGMKLNTV